MPPEKMFPESYSSKVTLTQPPSPQDDSAPLELGAFAASRRIVQESWAILRHDHELLLFPIISGIVNVIVVGLLLVSLFFFAFGGNIETMKAAFESEQISGASYVSIFAYYLVTFFIVNFFQAAMYIIIHGRFNGQNVTFKEGLDGAIENSEKIFVWSLISATVGVALRMVADRSKTVGKIVAGLLGAAWAILTYFSLPSLIIGKASIAGSFKESAALIRKTWGEALIIKLGVGLFIGLLQFVGVLVAGLTVFFCASYPIFWLMIVLLSLYLICLGVISSTLSAIFKLALYEYARTGKIPPGFSPALVQNAIGRAREE